MNPGDLRKDRSSLIEVKSLAVSTRHISPVKTLAALQPSEPLSTPNISAKTGLFPDGRLAREWKTMTAMIGIYCRGNHGTCGELCSACAEFTQYAQNRLSRCRFGAEKPTCANCPVHCYQKHHRDHVKVIMRYAGPRMLWRHPILSLFHWLDGRRQAPTLS
jgi:hypothetical protein